MPRPGPRRKPFATRLDDDTLEWLDTHAAILGLNRSEVIRLAIALAARTPLIEWANQPTAGDTP